MRTTHFRRVGVVLLRQSLVGGSCFPLGYLLMPTAIAIIIGAAIILSLILLGLRRYDDTMPLVGNKQSCHKCFRSCVERRYTG